MGNDEKSRSEARESVELSMHVQLAVDCEQTVGCKGNALLPGKQILMLEGKRSCPTCFNITVKAMNRCVRIPFMDLKLIKDLIEVGHIDRAILMLDQLIKDKSSEQE